MIALVRCVGGTVRWNEITDAALSLGSAAAAWDELRPPTLMAESDWTRAVSDARVDVVAWSVRGVRVTAITEDDYPARLRGIHQAPPVVFSRGALRNDDRAVSVVGSRHASEAGLRDAAGVARSLVKARISVLSGMAAGIDTAAHRSALAHGGRTVALLGTGIFRSYPAENSALQEQVGVRGLLLSQFWPDAAPRKQNFPMRNATMSGYGLCTVVIEAGEHSGARIQARVAVEHGRPVILMQRVVDSNEWARKLAARPNVHVASDSDAVVPTVSAIENRADAAGRTLGALVPSA